MTATAPQFGRVAVVGIGLIGGSVACGLRSRGLATEVVGYDPHDAGVAQRLGLVDRMAASAEDALRGADLVVLAAPVAANCDWLRRIGEAPAGVLGPQAVITDVSSTKRSIADAAVRWLGARLPRFVASHPIAGSERQGPDAASSGLFEGNVALLCPASTSAADAVERVEMLWRALGARIGTMTAQRHDELFAAVSHWPHAVAFALSAALGSSALADEARRFSGAGLRDTTRIGASSPTLWADILLDNRDASLAAASAFRAELDAIEKALADGDRDRLAAALARGADWRRTL
jgi:prephenate dehydrogenase